MRRLLFEAGARAVRRPVDRIAETDDGPLQDVLPVSRVERRTTEEPAVR